jgi:hypothetical protein
LEGLNFRGEGAAGKWLSPFIEEDSEAALGEFAHPLREARTGFDEMDFEFGTTPEPAGIFLDAEAGEIQRGLAGGEDFPGQRCTGLKSAAW